MPISLGIFLNPHSPTRSWLRDNYRQPRIRRPGEFRNALRIIVRRATLNLRQLSSKDSLSHVPSLYDMRNLFQVNVEKPPPLGHGLFAARYFAAMDAMKRALLERRSEIPTTRILEAFNQPSRLA